MQKGANIYKTKSSNVFHVYSFQLFSQFAYSQQENKILSFTQNNTLIKIFCYINK